MRLSWLPPVVLLVAGPITAGEAVAQPPPAGRQVYESACAACHGSDGRGGTAATSAYPLVPPDFTDCSFATASPTATGWP